MLTFIFYKGENKEHSEISEDIKTKITTIKEVAVYNHERGSVDNMDMDDYILCVVAGEMPASFHIEALKAQAISARTYTIYKSKHSGCTDTDKLADICTNSSHCQAYVSIEEMKENWGEDFQENYLKIKRAVDKTRGEVIVYSGDVIEVFYHASAGGMTEDSGHVFSAQRPYLVSVDSGGEQDSRNYYSEESFNYSQFIETLKSLDRDFEIDTDDIETQITKPIRYDTGRVDTIMIGNKTFQGTKIRKAFGLKSTNFDIDVDKDEIVFSCIGFGHGVGMSQNGANAMAKAGSGYIEILKHYFSGVDIINDY